MSICDKCKYSGRCEDEAEDVLDCGEYEHDNHFIPATIYSTENHSIERTA